jgi:hypothetical protein
VVITYSFAVRGWGRFFVSKKEKKAHSPQGVNKIKILLTLFSGLQPHGQNHIEELIAAVGGNNHTG